MDSTRLFERIKEYRKALLRLHEALALSENDVVRDSVIQRFEFTFELAWKAIKLWLEFRHIDVNYARDAIREALQLGLIKDGNGWTAMQKKRNQTSHTYDERTAAEVSGFIRTQGIELFDDLERSLDRMTEAL